MPSTPLELIDIHTRHISWNERVKSSNVKEYEKFLKRMSTVVKKRLSGTKPLTEYTTTRLEKLNANIEQDLRDINKKVYEQFKTQAKDLASYEAEFEVKSLEKLVEHSFVLPSTTQLNSAVFNTPLAQIEGVTKGKILESFFKDFDDSVVSKIQGSIISGYYTGLTNSQIVRSIIGTKKMNFMDGDFAKKRRHMEAVVRTGLQHAANQARQETWNNNKDIIKGVLWLATLDTRTTITCQALDQKVFPVDSGPRPPAHVNCRSTTVAQLDDRFSVLSEGRTRVARDPETGEVYSVNAKTQYYDWLKAESPAVQDSIIGPSRGKLLREGGLSSKRFAELQLGKNFEPLTLKQMKALEPLAFDRAGVLKNFTIDELMMMTEDISKMTPAQVATYKKQLAAFNKKVTAAKKRVIAAKKKVTIANKQLSAAKKKKSGVPEARAKVEAAKQKVADLDRELKELTGESVPGTSVVKISDSDILKTKKSLEQSGISLAHKISADTDIQLISAVTSINKEVEEILKVKIGIFSKNKIKDTVQNVSIQITNNSSILNDLKAVGSYSPSRHRILLKSDLPIGSDIKLGRYIVGKNMNDAFRHELGHTVYMNPKGFDQFDKILFTQAVDEIGGLQKLKTTVSTYASTNINEAFAECFSVLPKAIEIALDDMFGVTTKTATTTKKAVSVASTDFSDIAKIEEQLKNKFNMQKVYIENPLEKHTELLKSIEQTLSEDIYEKFPLLKEQLSEKSSLKHIYFDATKAPLFAADPAVLAVYDPVDKAIRLGNRVTVRPLSPNLQLGSYNVSKDFNSAFRHEYGHHVYSKVVTKEMSDKWDTYFVNNIFEEYTDFKKISTYADTDASEAFAETFAAITSPKYSWKGAYGTATRLPKDIEDMMISIIGKPKTATTTATTTKTVTKSVSVPRPPVTSKVSIPTMTELLSSDEVTDKYIEYLEDRAKKVVITKKAEDRIRKALSEQQKINIKLKTGVENNLKAKMSALPTAQQESYSEFKKYFKIDSSSDSAEAILIDRWATDSGRTEISQFMQFMAKEEFGLSASSTSDFFKLSDAGIAKKGFDAAKVKEGAKLFLREMYNETQAEFKRQGIKEITLFRGMNLQRDKVGSIINQLESGKIVAKLEGHNFRPLSSFSTSTDIAIHFAGEADDGGIHNVISIKVPVERIISSPVTGYGCRREFEYVVLGSNKTYDNVLSAYKLAPVDLPAGVPSEFLSPKNIFNAFESYANNF